MKRTCSALFLLLFGFAGTASAIDTPQLPGIQQGEKEISGNISIMNNSGGDFDSTNYMVLGSFGYFVTGNVQVKGSGLVFGTSGDSDMIMGSILVGADYLFMPTMEITPYAGGDVGVSYSKFESTDDTGVGFDVHVGIKQFLSDNTALNYELRYQMDTADLDSRLIMFMIGLNIYLQ